MDLHIDIDRHLNISMDLDMDIGIGWSLSGDAADEDGHGEAASRASTICLP